VLICGGQKSGWGMKAKLVEEQMNVPFSMLCPGSRSSSEPKASIGSGGGEHAVEPEKEKE